MNSKIKLWIVGICLPILAACGRPADVVSESTMNEAEGRQSAPASGGAGNSSITGSGAGDMLLGGALGYMLGGASANKQAPAPAPQVTKIYQRAPSAPAVQDVRRTYAPKPADIAPPKPSAPAPAPVPAPARVDTRPSYQGPSSYSSVRQSAPVLRSAPSVSRGGRR